MRRSLPCITDGSARGNRRQRDNLGRACCSWNGNKLHVGRGERARGRKNRLGGGRRRPARKASGLRLWRQVLQSGDLEDHWGWARFQPRVPATTLPGVARSRWVTNSGQKAFVYYCHKNTGTGNDSGTLLSLAEKGLPCKMKTFSLTCERKMPVFYEHPIGSPHSFCSRMWPGPIFASVVAPQ